MQCRIMLFGLVNALATFCRLMRTVLGDKQWLLSYLMTLYFTLALGMIISLDFRFYFPHFGNMV